MQRLRARVLISSVALLVPLGVSAILIDDTLPYKVMVSGPGINGEQVIWLADEPQTLEALQTGLLSETVAETPSASAWPYDITVYLGQCGAELALCRDDPETYTIHPTRYAYDAAAQRGALLHLVPPGWFEQAPPGPETWYRTPPKFDRAIQRLLILEGAPADVFLPTVSILPFLPSDASSASMAWLLGVAVLIAALYLMRRGRTDR
jgi:hypothetical protein